MLNSLPDDMINEIGNYLLSFDFRNVLIILLSLKREINDSTRIILDKKINNEISFLKNIHYIFGKSSYDVLYRGIRYNNYLDINLYLDLYLADDLSNDHLYRLFLRYNLVDCLEYSRPLEKLYIVNQLERYLSIDIKIFGQIMDYYPDLIPKMFINNIYRGDAKLIDDILNKFLINRRIFVSKQVFFIFFDNISEIKKKNFIDKLSKITAEKDDCLLETLKTKYLK